MAGAPVDAGASTGAEIGYSDFGGGHGAASWFNSFMDGGDWASGLLDPAQDPVVLSACEYIPGGTMTYDGVKGYDSDENNGNCVAKAKTTCEVKHSTN